MLSEFDLPTLIVTHDYEDAVTIADRVGVIVDGQLRQLGTPDGSSRSPLTLTSRRSPVQTSCLDTWSGDTPD